jgi:hypothetical protein
MSRFGWAYVNSIVTGAVANGPTNSIQFNSGSQVLSGSSNFTFNPATNEVTLLGELTGSTLVISASVVSASTYLGITGGSTSPGDGDKAIQFNSGSTFSGSTNLTFDYTTNTLYLTGTLRADNLIVSSSQILKSGSTIFGDDITDTHQFTGSILAGIVSGTTAQFTTISSSYVSASEIANVNFIDFYTSSVANPSYNPSRLFHDINTGDLSYYLPQVTNQQVQLGQQTVVKVKNSSGSPIAKGKLVHITGGVGNNPLINTASWENDNNSANTLGMLMSTVAHNDFGYVLLNGVITGVNTDPATFTAGQVIYLSSSGDYTATTPVAPKHTVRLGEVIRAHATVGSIFIKIDNGYEIDELHNVLITSASTGDLLSYNSSSALWTNSKSLSGSYIITGSLTATTTISGSTGSFASLSAYGPNQSIQYNNANVLTGSANLKFDGTLVTLTGSLSVVSGTTIVAEVLSSGVRTTGKPIIARNSSGVAVALMDDLGVVSGSIGRFGIVTGSTITASSELQVAGTSYLNSNANIGGNILGSGGFKANYATFSTNFTASSLSYFVGVSTTGSVVTASLNSATNYPAGQTLIFKDVGGNAGTNNIRIKPSGSQTIDGATSLIISNTSGSATIVSNGVDGFYIVGLT